MAKYKTFFPENFFLILRLEFESGPGIPNFHYSCTFEIFTKFSIFLLKILWSRLYELHEIVDTPETTSVKHDNKKVVIYLNEQFKDVKQEQYQIF